MMLFSEKRAKTQRASEEVMIKSGFVKVGGTTSKIGRTILAAVYEEALDGESVDG